MKKRSPGIIALLTVVTLGIYLPFWLYFTRREIVAKLNQSKAIPPFIVLAIPFICVAIFVGLSYMANSGRLFSGPTNSFLNAIWITSLAVGMVGTATVPLWWFYRYFQAVNKVTGLTSPLIFYALWLVCTFLVPFPIWMLLVQSDLNKIIDLQTAGPDQPASPAVTNA